MASEEKDLYDLVLQAARRNQRAFLQQVEHYIRNPETKTEHAILALKIYMDAHGQDNEAERMGQLLFTYRQADMLRLLQKACTAGEEGALITIILGNLIRHATDVTKQAAVEIVRRHRPEVLEAISSTGRGLRH